MEFSILSNDLIVPLKNILRFYEILSDNLHIKRGRHDNARESSLSLNLQNNRIESMSTVCIIISILGTIQVLTEMKPQRGFLLFPNEIIEILEI